MRSSGKAMDEARRARDRRRRAARRYKPEGHEFYGIMVFSLAHDAIASITGFADPALAEYFGLPRWLPVS